MSTVTFQMNDKTIQAEKGTTLLQAAKANGITIPSMCNSDKVKPYGACRLCMVEVTKGKRTRIVASCVYEADEGIVVRTDTEEVKKIRRMIIELLWPTVTGLAKEYGVESSRFQPKTVDCNLCGLCVRYCTEVRKLDAVFFKGRGLDRELCILPELAKECSFCKECHNLCSGGWIVHQAGQTF